MYNNTPENMIIDGEDIGLREAMYIYNNYPSSELMLLADLIRKKIKKENKVSWIIDRNINIGNVCVSGCLFCSFHCKQSGDKKAFETKLEDYRVKIKELFELGGEQVLLQGGLNPEFRLGYYETLFKELKKMFPALKLHALGPPEVYFLAKEEKLTVGKVLERLVNAGLDSLPGAGAEILCDRVRKIVSPAKCSSLQWLNVMRTAHKMNILATATMMFGHIETREERIKHILKIKQVQNVKPPYSTGFIAFIPWTFQQLNTALIEKYPQLKKASSDEYLRTLAMSRILLQNVENIQASWLTMGTYTAQAALHAGANDLGSIMIEENVVASAGVTNKLNSVQMKTIIEKAGFIPVKRNQKYEAVPETK